MANSYRLHTGNGSTTTFNIDQIDGWINSGFLKVYINDVVQPTGYTFLNINGVNPQVQFATAPANGASIRIQRETPATVSGFQGGVVNFNDGSVLTASDLDNMAKGLLHRVQESEDTGSGALSKTLDGTAWDAKNFRITNLAPGINNLDAVNMQQFTAATLFGGAATVPQSWVFNGNGGTTYNLDPDPLNLVEEMFIVEIGGIIQTPDTYDITSTGITFDQVVANGIPVHVRNFGVARVVTNSVTTTMITNNAVTTEKINNNAVTNTKLADMAARTVKGNATGATADPADIAATANSGAVLREASGTLGFGQVATAGLADSAVTTAKLASASSTSTGVTDAKLRYSAGTSIIGNSSTAAASPSDIVAADGTVLRRSGNTLAFGTLTSSHLGTDSVTTAKIVNSAVTTAKIADGSVTAAKLAAGLDWTDATTTTQIGSIVLFYANSHGVYGPGGPGFYIITPNGIRRQTTTTISEPDPDEVGIRLYEPGPLLIQSTTAFEKFTVYSYGNPYTGIRSLQGKWKAEFHHGAQNDAFHYTGIAIRYA